MASSTCSPLLSLPAELRNRIVQYALTSPTQTLTHTTASRTSKPTFEATPGREFNQLKYVCKQLYFETAGLEISYNALRFELPEDDAYALARIQNSVDSGFSAATIPFPPFLHQCSAAKLSWLRSIIITIRKPASYSLSQQAVDRLLSLARFTRANPRINITYEYVDEGREYKAPKYQYVVPWVSAAVCVGLACPVPEGWRPAVDALWGVCGRGTLLFWSVGFGLWEVVGMK